MAIVLLTDFYSNLDNWPGNLLTASDGVVIGTHTTTTFSYTFKAGTTFAGYSVTSSGTGFTYDGALPNDGNMTSFTITDGSGHTVLSVNNIVAGSQASDLGLFVSFQFGWTDPDGNFSGSQTKGVWSQLLSGNDTIFGSSGDDWRGLVGVDAGNDLYNMGTGDDWVNGGIGNDTINGGDGYDTLSYDQTAWNEGIPMVRGITVDVTAGTVLDPYGYTDHITGIEEIYGSAGRDVFYGGSGEVDFAGLRGSDTIVGGSSGDDVAIYGQDTWLGGTHGIVANLQVSTSGGKIFGTIRDGFGTLDHTVNIFGVSGTRYNDSFTGSSRDDWFNGGEGKDVYRGGAGFDIVNFRGIFGNGPQHGATVNMGLKSGQVIDDGFGNTENLYSIESVQGTRYDDLLIGNAAHNDLRGREGDDTLRGGGGHDTFRWNQFYEIGEHDVIQGFHAGAGAEQDKLKLGVTGWGGTTTLHLVNGTAATAAVDTFLFNPTTHLLSWDPDGTGAQAAISIATLTGVSSLTAANFDLG